MLLVRHNARAELLDVPAWFRTYLIRHLSVPVDLGVQRGSRFGVIWTYQGQRFGSMVNQSTVPAGLAPHVRALAKHYQVPYLERDARVQPEEQFPWWNVSASWRPYQDEVHKALVRSECGVINAPPRSGKTLMAARIIDTLAVPCVFIAPSVQIVRQTYEVLLGFYGEDWVSRLDGSARPEQRDPSRNIVVATAASAVAMSQEWWDTRDMLLIDEFHHAAAETYHRINDLACNVYWRYGFTGTHFRTGDDGLAMEAVCSKTLYKVDLEGLISNGYIAEPKVIFQHVRAPRVNGHSWEEAYRGGIVKCEERNHLVARTANGLLEAGVPTIVLTRQRAHADELAKRIAGAVAVKGGANQLTSAVVRDFIRGSIDCLVGTTVIGEGVDVPRAAALVYASGGNAGVAQMQSYYRPLTKADGKDRGRIYDFMDHHHGMLAKHSSRRLQMASDHLGSRRMHVMAL